MREGEWMNKRLRIRYDEIGAQQHVLDILEHELFVNLTTALPDDDLHIRHGCDVLGQIFVGDHDDPIDAQ